jgi:other hect domain ubiquitin protein ligase E3
MIEMALGDAMTLLENRLPNGLVIPDENHDWSAKIIDECIVGKYVLSKIKQRSSSESVHSSQFSMVLSKL